jgi:hypothetical protein
VIALGLPGVALLTTGTVLRPAHADRGSPAAAVVALGCALLTAQGGTRLLGARHAEGFAASCSERSGDPPNRRLGGRSHPSADDVHAAEFTVRADSCGRRALPDSTRARLAEVKPQVRPGIAECAIRDSNPEPAD